LRLTVHISPTSRVTNHVYASHSTVYEPRRRPDPPPHQPRLPLQGSATWSRCSGLGTGFCESARPHPHIPVGTQTRTVPRPRTSGRAPARGSPRSSGMDLPLPLVLPGFSRCPVNATSEAHRTPSRCPLRHTLLHQTWPLESSRINGTDPSPSWTGSDVLFTSSSSAFSKAHLFLNCVLVPVFPRAAIT